MSHKMADRIITTKVSKSVINVFKKQTLWVYNPSSVLHLSSVWKVKSVVWMRSFSKMYLSEHGFRELYYCHGVGMTFL